MAGQLIHTCLLVVEAPTVLTPLLHADSVSAVLLLLLPLLKCCACWLLMYMYIQRLQRKTHSVLCLTADAGERAIMSVAPRLAMAASWPLLTCNTGVR